MLYIIVSPPFLAFLSVFFHYFPSFPYFLYLFLYLSVSSDRYCFRFFFYNIQAFFLSPFSFYIVLFLLSALCSYLFFHLFINYSFFPVRFVSFCFPLLSVSLFSTPAEPHKQLPFATQSCFRIESIWISPRGCTSIYSCLQQSRQASRAIHSLPPRHPCICLLTALTINVTALFDFPIMCPLDPRRSATVTGRGKGNSYFNSWSIVLHHNSNTTTVVVPV
jgi:hypothetical protein